jgi:integrase
MASVYSKHGRYYARWKDAAGRWQRVVTAATTKKEAQRFAEDLERKAERQARGLETVPDDLPRLTFSELLDWWWSEYGSKRRGYELSFLHKRLLPSLGRLALVAVSPARLEAMLQSHVDELSPKSLNHLRALVHRIFALATRRGFWAGPNPASAVERRKVPQRVYETLRAEEVPVLLARLAPGWRPLFATAIWTGMRKGELFGLHKSDVDLEAGTITIRHSYDSDTTKGGRADVIPIAEPLRPFLQGALLASRSIYVFPSAGGEMRRRDTALQDILRRALARAGMVSGYEHACRRCKARGKPYLEHHPDAARRHCPVCGMKLWPKAVHREIRFHDLRGTTATLLARAGAPLVVAQRILRHTDPRLTANVYSRVDLGDLRAGLNRIDIPSMPKLAAASARLVPLVSPRVRPGKNAESGGGEISNDVRALRESGRQDLNLRPLGPEGMDSNPLTYSGLLWPCL